MSGFASHKTGSDLCRLVLEFKGAGFKQGRAGQIGRLARDAHTMRRVRRGRGRDAIGLQRGDHLVTPGLERVDPQISRCARDQGCHRLGQCIAEATHKFRLQPCGIFPHHPGRRGLWWRGSDCCAFGLGQRRRPIAAGKQRLDIFARFKKGCGHQRARGVAAQTMSEPGAMALDRKNLFGNGAAIPGAGKAAGLKPGLEKPVGGLGGCRQPVQNLDGHLKAGRRCHLSLENSDLGRKEGIDECSYKVCGQPKANPCRAHFPRP